MEYGPLKNMVNDTNFPQIGSFSTEGPINWQKCRETFANLFTPNISGFYFSHSKDNPNVSDAIYSFILKTEDVLRVSGIILDSTKISKTNRNFAIWVEPSFFWKECEFKRSLFTIFLRCGIEYNEDYEKALFSQKYIKDTIPAVKRFLFGFTYYDKTSVKKTGWVNAFSNKTKDDVQSILIKPSKPSNSENSNNFFGVGSLWN